MPETVTLVNPLVTAEKIVKEEVMESTTPVLPVTVPAYGGGYNSNCGLQGKDAVLIHSNQTALNTNHQLMSTFQTSKENVIEVLESKFATQQGLKNVELAVEKTERENQQQLQSIRRELESRVVEEGIKTRACIDGHFMASNAVALADSKSKILALEAQLAARKPVTTP